MRKFEFRAYDKEKKLMIYTDDQSWCDKYNMLVGDSLRDKVFSVGLFYETLSQFTGLNDENGKGIYEGDIIQKNCFDGKNEYEFLGVVVYDHSGFCLEKTKNLEMLSFGHYNKELNRFVKEEIIGNIYENPELLEK